MSAGWGFTDRPCITLSNAVFRGLIGGTGAKNAIVRALHDGTFIPSPHGTGELDHTEATRITPQEAGILQSYPADFVFQGTKTKIGLQIGNAVPPKMAEVVLTELWS